MTLKGMGNTGSTLRAKETLWRCIVIWKLTEVGKWYQEMIPHHHITLSAIKELRSQLSFTQLWFCCSKKQGRMFHVTTVSNSTVEAVVQYFSDQTDVPPDSCRFFQRMEDDNSKSVMECVSCNYQGKWSHTPVYVEVRLYRFAVYVPPKYHWHLLYGYWYCDDPYFSPGKSMCAKLLVQPNIISIFGWLSTQCGITISHFVKDKQIAFSPSFVDAVSSFYE